MIKTLLSLAVAISVSMSALADNIKLIIANPAGSSSDIVSRAIGDSFQELIGQNFDIEYAPGASGAVAAVKFQAAEKNTALLGITSLHIYNPVLKTDLPYKDTDFEPVAIVGLLPALYISRGDSSVKTVDDLVNVLPKTDRPLIGGYASVWNLNVTMLQNAGKLSKNVKIVGHKGAPAVVTNVLNGSVEVGMVSVTSTTLQLAKEGKINIIGSTAAEDFEYAGVRVRSVSKRLGVDQTMGGLLLSLKPNSDPEFTAKFVATLKRAIATTRVQEAMRKTLLTHPGVVGTPDTYNDILARRKAVTDLIK